MIEVKAAALALIAAAVFLTGTVLGIGNGARPAVGIPGAVHLGAAVSSPDAVAPGSAATPAGPGAGPAVDRSRDRGSGGPVLPAPQQPGTSQSPAVGVPVVSTTTAATVPVAVPSPLPTAVPTASAAGTAATPAVVLPSTTETVTRPVVTGQLDEFDDDDDDDNSGPSGNSGPGSGNSGSGSGSSGPGSGK